MRDATGAQSAEHQRIRVRARGDLIFQQQTYQGETSWLVKDPVSLRYFRLREELCAALQMLDGQVSLHDIKTELERRFPTVQVKYAELQSLLGMLHRSGLVLAEAHGQGEQLYERHRERRRRQVLGQLAAILWVRFPGVDPERFLSWLYPKVKWFYSRWCVAACAALAFSALLLVAMNFHDFVSKLPNFQEFFQAGNLHWLMLALATAKVLHELGHGLTCKHFGGECHQIGVLFLVFTPCLYCDTSDAWILPNKWHRAAIGAAGMYVEVVLASICTFIWWNTQPGMIHFLCLNIMLICSISTVIFNSNPLLRYDGYYILSDILEIPNLSRKARQTLIGLLRQWCLGMPWNKEAAVPQRQRLPFALYAVLSVCYRWFIVIAILWFLSEVLEPYGLQAIAHVFIASALVGLLVVPLVQVFKFFYVPGRMSQVNRVRFSATAAVILAVVLVAWLAPIPHRVMTSVVIQPQDAERIYVNVEGSLDELLVEEGAPVAAQETLAVLKNPDISYQLVRLDGERKRLQQRLQNLGRQQRSDPDAAQQIPSSQKMLDSLDERWRQLRKDEQRLNLVAHRAGVVMPPPLAPGDSQGGALPTWSRTPLDKSNANCWLETGTLFCLVGDPLKMEATLVIDQTDMEFVREGQDVHIKLDEYPQDTWRGKIEEIARIDLQVAPRGLSRKSGGGLGTEKDGAGAERPSSISYQARVSLDNSDGRLLAGLRGRAKILVAGRTAGQAVMRFLAETLRLR